jgi:hypothetical protein
VLDADDPDYERREAWRRERAELWARVRADAAGMTYDADAQRLARERERAALDRKDMAAYRYARALRQHIGQEINTRERAVALATASAVHAALVKAYPNSRGAVRIVAELWPRERGRDRDVLIAKVRERCAELAEVGKAEPCRCNGWRAKPAAT